MEGVEAEAFVRQALSVADRLMFRSSHNALAASHQQRNYNYTSLGSALFSIALPGFLT